MGIRNTRVPRPPRGGNETRAGEDDHAGVCLAVTALLSALLVLAGPACSRGIATALDRTTPDGIADSADSAGVDAADTADADAPFVCLPLGPPVALGICAAAAGALLLIHRVVRHAVRDGITEAVLLLEGLGPALSGPLPGPTPSDGSPACPDAPRCGPHGR